MQYLTRGADRGPAAAARRLGQPVEPVRAQQQPTGGNAVVIGDGGNGANGGLGPPPDNTPGKPGTGGAGGLLLGADGLNGLP